MFGPPTSYWTGRFESKHRVAKNTAETSKNTKNITKTISERQQYRAASIYYQGMFNTSTFVLPENVNTKDELSEDNEFHVTLKNFMSCSDLTCREILYRNQQYFVGEIVILEVEDCDSMYVGLIEAILVKSNTVYFVCRKYKAIRNSLQYFEAREGEEGSVCHFMKAISLPDYRPLKKRGSKLRFEFVLHHFIRYGYCCQKYRYSLDRS